MKFLTGLLTGVLFGLAVLGLRPELFTSMAALTEKAPATESETPLASVEPQATGEESLALQPVSGEAQIAGDSAPGLVEAVAVVEAVEVVEAAEIVEAAVIVEESANDVETPAEPVLPAPVTVSRFQAAWTPFRSEASATGFAQQLSRDLGRTFRVEKVARGRYLVGFDYQDEAEKALLLSAISAL